MIGFNTDKIGSHIEKDPQSTLDYTIDWSSWVTAGDAIATSTWVVETIAGDVTPVIDTNNVMNVGASTSTVWLSGGDLRNTYRITNTITTTNGLTDERFFRLKITNKSG
jgi:hypothetical protein